MGVDLATWRARIGCFSHPARTPGWKSGAITLTKGVYRALLWTILLSTTLVYNTNVVDSNVVETPLTELFCSGFSVVGQGSGLVATRLSTFSRGMTEMNTDSDHVYLVIETALVCSGLETNPGPTTDSFCIESCKKGRKDVGDMVRCCLCGQWFHPACLNLDSSEAVGVWPCLDCRRLNSKVTVIMDNMAQMTRMMTAVTNKLDKVQDSWDNEKEQLVKENSELRKTVSDLQLRVNKRTWTSFRKPNQRSLLVGSSIIRDIDESKLEDTKVICKSGGCIKDVEDVVKNLTHEYEEITLVVGGNDCDSATPKTAQEILEAYGSLMDTAKTRAEQINVSSICPRLKSQQTTETIQAVNAGLTVLCADKNATFKDNSQSFYLGDGTVNDGYLQNDGVHITRAAVNKLAQNIALRIKDKAEGACRDRDNDVNGHKQQSQRSFSLGYRPSREGYRTDFDRDSRQKATDRGQRSDVRCYFCGEGGHVKDKCRHGKQIQCNVCKAWGHKAKFCKRD